MFVVLVLIFYFATFKKMKFDYKKKIVGEKEMNGKKRKRGQLKKYFGKKKKAKSRAE